MILLPPPAQCIRWYARTRTPTDACSIWAVAGMPIWSDLSLLILRRYSTSFGVSLINRNLDGSTPGASAISSCGIIAAPCTDAMRSTRIRAASCTAPKSRASNDQRKRGAQGSMRRREFITLLGGAAAWPLAARAQTKRMRRIGVLMGLVANDPEAQSRVVALENGLRELKWIKGHNLSIEYRWAGDGVLRDHAAELLAMAPDLILANRTPVTVRS